MSCNDGRSFIYLTNVYASLMCLLPISQKLVRMEQEHVWIRDKKKTRINSNEKLKT